MVRSRLEPEPRLPVTRVRTLHKQQSRDHSIDVPATPALPDTNPRSSRLAQIYKRRMLLPPFQFCAHFDRAGLFKRERICSTCFQYAPLGHAWLARASLAPCEATRPFMSGQMEKRHRLNRNCLRFFLVGAHFPASLEYLRRGTTKCTLQKAFLFRNRPVAIGTSRCG